MQLVKGCRILPESLIQYYQSKNRNWIRKFFKKESNYINSVRVLLVFSASAIRLAPAAPTAFFWMLHKTPLFHSTFISTLMIEIRAKGVGRSLQNHQFAVTLEDLCEGLSACLFDAIALQADKSFAVKHGSWGQMSEKKKWRSLEGHQGLVHFKSLCQKLGSFRADVVVPETKSEIFGYKAQFGWSYCWNEMMNISDINMS